MRLPLRFVAISLVATLCLLVSAGCATIVHGSNQDVPIASEPSDASVLVDGVRVGSTPTTVPISRKKNHVVTIELTGYETENITLTHSMSGAVAGNIIAGGLIGWGVDASTGGQYKLVPDSINLRLRTVLPPPTPIVNTPQSEVGTLMGELQKLDDLRKSGKITDEEYARLRSATLDKYSQSK